MSAGAEAKTLVAPAGTAFGWAARGESDPGRRDCRESSGEDLKRGVDLAVEAIVPAIPTASFRR